MKGSRTSITKIINLITDKFADGEDIYGFQGITKNNLVETLNESYNLLSELEKRKETFEFILLKRFIAENSKQILKYFDIEKPEPKDFNLFLNKIANLKYKIRETYLLIVEDVIRDEAEIARIRDFNTQLRNQSEEYNTQILELLENLKDCQDAKESIVKIFSAVQGADEKIDAHLNDSIKKLSDIKNYADEAEKLSDEIDTINENIKSIEEDYKDKSSNINALQEKSNLLVDKIDAIEKQIQKQNLTSKSQLEEIRKIIDDANRASMAGSFKKRKDELDRPIIFAEITMTVSLLLLTGVAVYLIGPDLVNASQTNYYKTLLKLPILFPLVWIAWMNAKKFGYLTRIKEDYAFKYASAMAFEGYKKHAEDYDELQERLLKISIENMGSNPIRLFEVKNNHASPANEFIDNAKDIVKDITKLKKSANINNET